MTKMRTMAANRRTLVPVAPFKLFFVPLLLLAAASLGAAPGARIACGQCEETDRFVRFHAITPGTDLANSQRFTHPFALSPEDWKSILTELHVQRQADLLPEPPRPVLSAFSEEEVGYLSATLSKAFARVQPNEWIVFGLSGSTPQGFTEVTTGGGYVEGASLHFVLANYRKVVTMPSTRQLLWEHPLRPDAGPAYDLVAGTHQTIVRASSFVPRFLSSVPSELAIAYEALLLGERGTASMTQNITAATPMATPPPTRVAPPVPLEERLQRLKRLRDQALITEEEYTAKKKQLLDQF